MCKHVHACLRCVANTSLPTSAVSVGLHAACVSLCRYDQVLGVESPPGVIPPGALAWTQGELEKALSFSLSMLDNLVFFLSVKWRVNVHLR